MKSNPLHLQVFTSSFKMEAELIQMVNMVYGGNMESCGTTTYTMEDNALCIIQCYKRWAKKFKKIVRPNIVCLSSIHPRYTKACRNYEVEMRVCELGISGQVSLKELRSKIDSNTICAILSAPTEATGRMEPVVKVAEICREFQIGLHVDSGLGMITPFLQDAGFDSTYGFDFRVPGVTTISVSLDTYGRMPAGCTVILFRTKQLRRFQYYGYNKWCGGLYLTSGLCGSRTAANVAACWAKI